MAETPKRILTGKNLLQAQGIPEDLLIFLNQRGLRPDYMNYWAEWIMDVQYNPTRPHNDLTRVDAGERIREILGSIPTYTEYWMDKIKEYNMSTKTRKLNMQGTLALVTGIHPAIETLDLLARNIRSLSQKPGIDPHTLMNNYAIAYSNVSGIFRDGRTAEMTRERFGIQTTRRERR